MAASDDKNYYFYKVAERLVPMGLKQLDEVPEQGCFTPPYVCTVNYTLQAPCIITASFLCISGNLPREEARLNKRMMEVGVTNGVYKCSVAIKVGTMAELRAKLQEPDIMAQVCDMLQMVFEAFYRSMSDLR